MMTRLYRQLAASESSKGMTGAVTRPAPTPSAIASASSACTRTSTPASTRAQYRTSLSTVRA